MVLGVKGQFGNRGGIPIVRAGGQENRENQHPKIRYEGCRKDAYQQRPLGEAAGEIGADALSHLHPSPQLPPWSRMSKRFRISRKVNPLSSRKDLTSPPFLRR